ncbi:hypothetical protein RJT34_13540 [Clitoria ternatea]|uniref:Uncharacterized protein n=1 Tax=Clitoria ternatea TaxID=43366 RepID=A0AAN9JRQ7_CLITE
MAYSWSEYGEYNLNSYALNYDCSQVPSFSAYTSYDYNQPYYVYDPNSYYAPNYPSQGYQTMAYSARTFNDPKSFVYDPNYGMTQLVISYSNLEFNEPAFDDYDPTPYDSGYDIAQTYGKPLPPSDKICYPRSGSSSISAPSDPVPSGAIVPLLPTVKEGVDEKSIIPQNGSAVQTTEEKPKSQDSSKDQPREVEDSNYDTSDLDPDEGGDSEENNHEDEHYSGSGFGDGYSGGQSDEHEKLVPPQYPSGYGLEAVDLCESLFGYWPCLARMKKREHCCEQVIDRGNYNCQENMWKGTADYLFGNPYPYSGKGEDGSSYGGDVVYGYERHYPSQAQYRQIDYSEKS